MLTLYHLATSRSDRIIWLLEELGLPYAVERLDREPNLAAPERLKQVHPLGKAPTIRDGDVVLTESGAIVDYVTRRLGGGRLSVAPEAPGFADYLFWLHFAEGSFAGQLLREWYIDLLSPNAEDDPRVTRVRQNGRAMMALVEQRLATVPFFAGDTLTGADIMMSFPFTTMQNFVRLDLADRPAIAAYVERIRQRPAWRRAMAVAEGRAPG